MDVGATVLLLWIAAVTVAVGGVVIGVLMPARSESRRELAWWSNQLEKNRVWVLAALVVTGVGSGTLSALDRLGVPAAGPTAGEQQSEQPTERYGQWYIGKLVDAMYSGVRDMTGDVPPESREPQALAYSSCSVSS